MSLRLAIAASFVGSLLLVSGCAVVSPRVIAEARDAAMHDARALGDCPKVDGEYAFIGTLIESSGRHERNSATAGFGSQVLGRSFLDESARSFALSTPSVGEGSIVIEIRDVAASAGTPTKFEWRASCAGGFVRMFRDLTATSDGSPSGGWEIQDWSLDPQGNLIWKREHFLRFGRLFWQETYAGRIVLKFDRVLR